MIELRDVCKQFGATQVLININASFEDEKIHGLIGRNGSGKTVLLKCICGLIRPTSGLRTPPKLRSQTGEIEHGFR